MAQNTLFDALAAKGYATPDRIFATTPDGISMTFGDFFTGARKISAALKGLNLAPGDRVAMQVEKSLAALQLYLGTIMAGGVFLPLNPAYTKHEIRYFLSDATPLVFVCDPARQADLRPLASETGVQTLLTLGADGTGGLADLAATQPDTADPVDRGPDDLAAILYTSGTTGRSKGAMLSHRALTSNSQTLMDLWRFTDRDTLIHALPIFHTHGLFVATNIALMAGSSLLFHQKFVAADILAAFQKATALMGVPTFYTRLLDQPGLNKSATANMRLFTSGSAPLLSQTHRQWQDKTGQAILERYGLTETNMNTSNPYDGDRRPGTVGFPLPDVELKICDPESGATLAQGETGIIEVRGPNVFSGYWNMPDKTAQDLRDDGFMITGDLGYIDDDGYVHIVGRSKDLVISGGFNVYPIEVETVLDSMDGIKESAVIGAPHPDFGEAVIAVIVPEQAENLTPAEITDFVTDRIAAYKRPKYIDIIPELPRNAMGKVQKNRLRQRYDGVFTGGPVGPGANQV